eukprot:4848517-Lingulodinium_polyedra.AAC.1
MLTPVLPTRGSLALMSLTGSFLLMATKQRRLLRAMAFRMFSRVTGWPPSSSLRVSPRRKLMSAS